MDGVKELTIKDLAEITWDCNNGEFIGTYLDNDIQRHLFFLPDHPFPMAVFSCNLSEGWAEYYLFEDMQVSKLNEHHRHGDPLPRECSFIPLRDEQGLPRTKRHKYDGKLYIFNSRGETIAKLSGDM